MTILPPEIDQYAAQHSTQESEVFAALVTATHSRTKRPQMQVGRIEGALLRILAHSIRARRVLEIGTFTGYSALCFAEALPDDGEVVTCDIDPEATSIAREFWRQSPHGKKIRLELGDATETLTRLEGTFDLIFIDADKTNYPRYWKEVSARVRPGGLILMDNVLWGGSVVEADPDEDTRAIMEATRLASADDRFRTVLLTVRDGILLASRK